MAWLSADGSQQEGSPPPGYTQGPGGRWAPGGSGAPMPTGGAIAPPPPIDGSAGQPIAASGYNPADKTLYGPGGVAAPPATPQGTGAQFAGPQTPEQLAAAAAQRQLNNKFNYGGFEGGAAQHSGFYRGEGIAAQSRQGEQINYGLAQGYNDQAQQSRGNQNDIYGLMRSRAMGQTPSIAGMQADRQMRQAAAEQSSAAASARGPAAMALAQQGAAANTAGLQSNISNMAQINAAQERERAEAAAFGAASGMRGQDFQGMGMQADMAQKQAALNAAQRAQNDQYSLGLFGNDVAINQSQLGAQGNQVGIAAGQQTAANQLAFAGKQADRDNDWKTYGAVAGGVGTALGVGAALYGSGLLGGGQKPMDGGSTAGGGGREDGNTDQYSEQGYGGSMEGYVPPTVGGDTSDVTAKQNIQPLGSGGGQASAWDEGHRAALEDMKKLAAKSPQELKSYGDHPLAAAVREMKAGAWDEGRGSQGGGLQQPSEDPRMAKAREMIDQNDAQKAWLLGNGASVGNDRVTEQFAQGLAPSSFDYTPGMGTPGHKVGPMAQNMAANPVTGSAVRRNPQNGLLAIDGNDGLKVALGGVGHLAQKQTALEAELANLRRMSSSMMQGTQAQSDGLMSQGPSVGSNYLSFTRGQ
jgi:hypothetical protein